ncbi:MAG: hypothetical protein M1840_007934 [Geoglossum simile]|nr:MAG: hypothetical protein M1840_007934 [Geoglossum simile]
MLSNSQSAHCGPPQTYQIRDCSLSYRRGLPGVRSRHLVADQWSTADVASEDNLAYPGGWLGTIQSPNESAPADAPTTPAKDTGGAPGEGTAGSGFTVQSPTRTRSAGGSVPGGDTEGPRDNKTRFPCDYPGCLATFSRPQDIPRHKSSIHKLPGPRYPCPLVGDHDCSREDGFPRKDKLVAHLRQRHKVPDQRLSVPTQDDACPIEGPQDKQTGTTSSRESRPLDLPNSPKGALGQVEIDHHTRLNTLAGGSAQGPHYMIPISNQAVSDANPLSTATPSLSGPVQLPSNTLGRSAADNNHSRYQYLEGGCRQALYLPETPAYVDRYGTRNALGFDPGNIHESLSSAMSPNPFQLSGPQTNVHWTPPGPFQQEKAGPILRGVQPHGVPTTIIPASAQRAGPAENRQFQHSPEYVSGGQPYWTGYGASPAVSPFSLQQHQRSLEPPPSQEAGAPSTIRLLPILETALDSVYRRQSEKGYKQNQSYH